MNNLFLGFSLLSLFVLIIGLIKPSLVKTSSRKEAAKIFGTLFVILFVLFGITSPSQPTSPVATTEQTAAFDVPSLVGKDLAGVTKILGTANKDNSELTPEQLKLSNEWSKSWEKNGQELLVTYNPKTGVVTDFFIGATEGVTTDTSSLLKAGSLNENDPAYQVEFVKALKGGGYTGVKVTPK